jgi:predicted metal-dependent enzyme (double-stranded beta helix superfamily)
VTAPARGYVPGMNMSKIAYKPVGLIGGAVAGVVAGFAFKRLWRLAADEPDTPEATDENRHWPEILLAAALQGAIFAVVKATVDRAGATGMRRLTGQWPQ